MHIFLSSRGLIKIWREKEKSSNEDIEDIEILRFLDMGHSVLMVDVNGSSVAVDTEEDLKRAQKYYSKKATCKCIDKY